MNSSFMEVGQAIYCNCYIQQFDRYKMLGSITPEGLVEILRSHNNKTIIETHEFIVTCKDCGFRKYIRIESMALKQPAYNEK